MQKKTGDLMPKFRDIPKLTGKPRYRIDVQIDFVKANIEDWTNPTAGAALEISPDFQRAHVWTEQQQISFVEFLLKGGDTSPILFNCKGWGINWEGPFQLVDGKQRLTALLRFLNNEIPAFGAYYKEYTDSIRFADTRLQFWVNNLKTRKEVLQWYLEINSGGTPHTAQELDKVKELLKKESE